jgi:hypothetical protein
MHDDLGGRPDLDAAAMNAVRLAAPFPPPPKGDPHAIWFHYDTSDVKPGQQAQAGATMFTAASDEVDGVIASDVIVHNNSCSTVAEFRLNGVPATGIGSIIGPGETVTYEGVNQCLHTLQATSTDGKTWVRNFDFVDHGSHHALGATSPGHDPIVTTEIRGLGGRIAETGSIIFGSTV